MDGNDDDMAMAMAAEWMDGPAGGVTRPLHYFWLVTPPLRPVEVRRGRENRGAFLLIRGLKVNVSDIES